MDQRFAGKVALVTGGAVGIGAAIVERLSREGAQVVSIDLNAPLKRRDGVVERRGDVTSGPDMEVAVVDAQKRFGRIYLLVNNAGIGALAETPLMDPETWNRMLAVNLSSIFHLCRSAIPLIGKAGGGAIVNVASISGLSGDYGMGAYNATKAGVINYTRSLALDCAAQNIRVNVLCPGPVTNTAMGVGTHGSAEDRQEWVDYVPMKRHGQPEEMASVVAFLLSDEASYMTGSVVVADGGASAHTGQPDVIRQRRRRLAAAGSVQTGKPDKVTS